MRALQRLLFGLALTGAAAVHAADPTLDEILAKNYEARGGLARLQAVKTVSITGTMSMNGMQAPFTMQFKRPDRMRMEFTLQGMTGIQAYDGKAAWQVMPFAGKLAPEPMTAEEQTQFADQADIEGTLVDWKKKGHKVELVGQEAVEGTPAYKLAVTTKAGNVQQVYLDAEAFLEIQVKMKIKMQGQEIETVTSLGDYKDVAGMMVPHAMTQTFVGMPMSQSFTIAKIEYDLTIDDARFAMPAKTEAPAPAPPK